MRSWSWWNYIGRSSFLTSFFFLVFFFCLSVCLSLTPSLSLSTSLSVCLSLTPSLSLSLSTSLSLSVCLSLTPCLCLCLRICLSLYVCLSVCQLWHNRRSSEIQGTALGKCLQAWLVYRSMLVGVAQSRHAFVGGTVSTWGRWRIPVKKRQKRHQKMPIKRSLFVGNMQIG